ncbi:GDSL-type esterase/lipase family protein [Clostridium sp. E02]|uniref:GDSL-type esterase/lipase family protein n=1 Tax=Clostridium sp. E02 TaxID=2487134 RepID=UPI000F524945|nr:GDSL-type esterase/lipase family protein [Clostridium sp. E02]
MEESKIETDHSYLQYCGRVGTDDRGRPEFVYPCSFVKLYFMGERISVRLENHSIYWDNYIGWILDGTQKKAKLPKTGATRVLLGDHLGEGIHSLLLFKRQDSCHTVSLEGFLLSKGGRLLKPEPLPDYRIEVYGDSVSAGEVSEAINDVGKEDPVHQGEYSNSWYSYAWLTARKLNARIHNISQGGIALMDGTGWFEPPRCIGMQSVYDKIQYHPALLRTRQWDFEKYRPNVVIVALGQNDSHPIDFMKEDYTGLQAQQWKEHYMGFVRKLRTLYPEAIIILTTTILYHHENWDRAIEEVCQVLEDKQVSHFLYRRNGVGTPGHIRIPEAEEMAEELTAFIKRVREVRAS